MHRERGSKYKLKRVRYLALEGVLLLSIIFSFGCAPIETEEALELSFITKTADRVATIEANTEYSYKPLSKLQWADVNEEGIGALDGNYYWGEIPGVAYGLCTGYVSWIAMNYLGVLNYPHATSTFYRRNGGEYVSSQRMWLLKNAYYVGSATTEKGHIEYHGGRYLPGDIIVFNFNADGKEGALIERESFDYWGDEREEYFTHIAVVGSDNTLWEETLDSKNITATAVANGTLPSGLYNMHHNAESYGGVCNILCPEQFITRDASENDHNYSRSYEIYRVLSPTLNLDSEDIWDYPIFKPEGAE